MTDKDSLWDLLRSPVLRSFRDRCTAITKVLQYRKYRCHPPIISNDEHIDTKCVRQDIAFAVKFL